jgi:YHS domain-containing protein
MMITKNSTIGLLTVTTVLLFSCSSGGNMHHKPSGSAAVDISPDILAQITDPVCGMNMTQTKIADTATVNGKLYAFCNPGCKDEFVKNPDQYLK